MNITLEIAAQCQPTETKLRNGDNPVTAAWRQSTAFVVSSLSLDLKEIVLDKSKVQRKIELQAVIKGVEWDAEYIGGITRMAGKNLKVGDTIRVIGYRPGKYPPGITDEMGTEKLFKSLVGRRYTIKGFDDYGNIELKPKRLHTVWIEPDLVELVEDADNSA